MTNIPSRLIFTVFLVTIVAFVPGGIMLAIAAIEMSEPVMLSAGGCSLFLGFLVSWMILFKLLESSPEHYRMLQNETPTVVQETVIERYYIIELKGESHRISFFGMSVDEWMELGRLVVQSNYAYNQTQFEQILGRVEELGRKTYYRVSGALAYSDEFLVAYRNGYKLTDIGKELFDKVAKGDWRVLNELEDTTN